MLQQNIRSPSMFWLVPQVHHVVLVVSSVKVELLRVNQHEGEKNHQDLHWLLASIHKVAVEHIGPLWRWEAVLPKETGQEEGMERGVWKIRLNSMAFDSHISSNANSALPGSFSKLRAQWKTQTFPPGLILPLQRVQDYEMLVRKKGFLESQDVTWQGGTKCFLKCCVKFWLHYLQPAT